jgi:hypothetical protein
VYKQLGLTYYHVSPLKDLEVSGKPQKNVIGFDKDYAYTFTDSKKKPLEGSTELKNNLALARGDVCAGFAVNVSPYLPLTLSSFDRQFIAFFQFHNTHHLPMKFTDWRCSV